MLRTFQFRLKPNAAQLAALTRILEDNCETYNAALQERRDAWKMSRTHDNNPHGKRRRALAGTGNPEMLSGSLL